MNVLKQFYDNENEREAVKEFMITVLGEIAIDRAFAGDPTSGIQEARECIEKSFDKLGELYAKIKPTVIPNSR